MSNPTEEMKKEAYHKFGQLMRSFFYKHYVSILLANLLKTPIYQGFMMFITSCRPYRPFHPFRPCQAFRRRRRFLQAYQR
jgi:hypothetical protein